MNNRTISAIFLLLLASQGFILLLSPTTSNGVEMNLNPEDALIQNFEQSEIDLDRVNLLSEAYENGDVEDWTTPRDPADLSTFRTTDRMSWYEQGVENEGARALGMRARGADVTKPAVAQIVLNGWSNSIFPNLTLSMDWRAQQVPFPELGDRLELYLPFHNEKNVIYCFGGDISVTNTSSDVYYVINDSLGTWHKLERNITSDFIEAFGSDPGVLYRFSFFARSHGFQYTYGYFDDFNLITNGTVLVGGGINHGNFEASGSGYYWWNFNSVGAFGDISRSTDRIEGDFSINTTIRSTSNGHLARARFSDGIERSVNEANKDVFTFSWRITDIQLVGATSYVSVGVDNATSGYMVYYVTAASGPTIPDLRSSSNDLQFNMNNVNETGDWTTFNTSVYEDIQSVREDKSIYIGGISVSTTTDTPNAGLTVLYDNISFIATTFGDQDYENQGSLGSNVQGWYGSYDGCDEFTVTDFSHSGEKAGNFTLSDDYDEWCDREFDDDVFITSENEMILEFNWFLEYNQSSEDFFILELSIGEYYLDYIIMNTTTLSDDILDGSDPIFIVPEANTEGEWINLKIDLAHDYEEGVGKFPNTTLDRIALWGYANVSSQFTVFIDDFYLYEDSAPEITDISQTPSPAEAGEFAEISVTVVDATEIDATLHHRVGAEDWVNTSMTEFANNVFEANITDLLWDTEVEYFVSVIDAFNKTDTILDGSSYFVLTVDDTLNPNISFSELNNESAVSGSTSVNISASDSGSGIAYVEIYIDDALVLNDTTSPYSYDWNTTSLENGSYIIEATAYDIAGNSESISISVTVSNAETTTTPPPSDFDPLLIAMVIGIVGVIVVIVVLYLVKFKKN